CTICGVIRRRILNKNGRLLKMTKIVTGHNLDDETQTLMMNYIRGDISCMARTGPKTGIKHEEMFVQRVKPLFFCLEEEVRRYSQIRDFPVQYEPCPCSLDSYRTEVKKYLDELETESPGMKMQMVKGFIELVPNLKKQYMTGSIDTCKICGEPSSGKTCRACTIIKMLN
ncbi:MAG: TIGR00269 family protein, partial [Candidatus Altiarchaeota archaeon]|nr:TIGR00269 family protein [Candidatus Altiarchaeota archaeon]